MGLTGGGEGAVECVGEQVHDGARFARTFGPLVERMILHAYLQGFFAEHVTPTVGVDPVWWTSVKRLL